MDTQVTICPHMEKRLKIPTMRDGDPPRYVPSESAARSSVSFYQIIYPSFSEEKFRTLLRNYGFVDAWDIELLVSAYFYRERQYMIADEYGVSQETVSRRLKTLRKLLKERGFEQEME